MIKYNSNTINDWNYGDDNIVKVYYHNAICYYKITTSGGTTAQTPCFAVVDDISQYSDREFEDVFNKADEKWYKKNNLNQYEEYGIYGSGRTITTYDGKLTIDDGYEYQYSGNSWVNVGEVSGSSIVPIGYEEVEYIQNPNDSLAYIDTGFKPNQDTRIVCQMQIVNSSNYGRFIGSGSYNSANAIQFDYETGAQGKLHISWGAIGDWTTYSSCIGDYDLHEYDWDKNYFYRDKGESNQFSATTTYTNFQCTDNLGIFAYILNGSVTTDTKEHLYGKLYSFQIYDNGTLIRNFAPCKRKSDNIYGVYDIVNDSFYSSEYESYQFTGGSATTQVVYPVYYSEMQDPPNNLSFSSMTEAEEYECPWVGMSAEISNVDYMFCDGNEWLIKYTYVEVTGDYICDGGNKYKKMQEYDRNPDGSTSATTTYVKGDLIESASTDCSSRLPSGYTEVEYIENTSTAYIDTSFKPNQDTRIVAEMQCVTSSQYGRYIGCGGYNNTNAIQFDYETGAQGELHISWGTVDDWTTYSSCVGDYNVHIYDWDKNYFYRDKGELNEFSATTTYSSFQCTDNLAIFTFIDNGSPSTQYDTEYLFGRMYSFQIYDNGTLIRDLIPCKRNSDNMVGAYDIVNDVFYVPNGGNLIAGNPV